MSAKKTVVKVSIVGDEYAIRSDASPEHTRAVAEYVDRAIRAVMNGSGLVSERHKAAILAALEITDELFREREGARASAAAIRSLAADVRRHLPSGEEPTEAR